jgi:hypothetical protein
MIRLTLDLPESLHKTLKSLAVLNGDTMRSIAITALERYTQNTIAEVKKKQMNASDVANKLKLQFETGEITEDEFKEKFYKVVDYLGEDEADKILMPYLVRVVEKIESGDFKGRTLAEIKADCLANK